MSLQSLLSIRYEDGVYADPATVTAIGRVLSNYSSSALEASAVVCRTSALVSGVYFYNTNNAAQFGMIFDASSLPANGAITPLVFNLGADAGTGVNWFPYPRAFSNGVVVCNSSTNASKTLGSADCFFDVQFIS